LTDAFNGAFKRQLCPDSGPSCADHVSGVSAIPAGRAFLGSRLNCMAALLLCGTVRKLALSAGNRRLSALKLWRKLTYFVYYQ
jgi:hypothetical protein